jgi:hypothetical protein
MIPICFVSAHGGSQLTRLDLTPVGDFGEVKRRITVHDDEAPF